MTAVTPVRYPDLRSVPLMTKRAGWLVVLNLLIPGSAQVLAGNRRMGRFGLAATLVFWVIAAVTIALWFADRTIVLTAVTNSIFLWVIVILLAFYAVLWITLTLDTLRLVRFVRLLPAGRGIVAALAVVGLFVTGGGAIYGAYNASIASGLFSSIFRIAASEPPIDGRYNILLIGGDAGPDRLGLRPDSMSVASIDAETGAVTLLGIPRNLQNAPFSAGSPMLSMYPDGYDCGNCLIDYVYNEGIENPELYPDATKNGSTPAIEAVRDAVQGVTGLKLQYYVIIDMAGMASMIDSLGGIDINVPERTPWGSNEDLEGNHIPAAGYIEAGQQHMDGTTALNYARTRYGSSDYSRMAHQRLIQEALLKQMEPANVLAKFQGVAATGSQVVSTDIPQQMLAYFVELAQKSRALPVTSVNFVPPEIDPADPDFDLIQQKVTEATAPVTASPTPSP